MPRWLVFGVAWLAAAAGALALAFWGVGVVGDQVTGDRPEPLSAAEVATRAGDATTTTSTTAPPATTAPTPTTSPPSSVAPPAAGPTTTVAPPPTTAPPAVPAGETRTYNLTGGSTSLRFEPTGVTVLWANPNPGFEVSTEPEGGNGVKVEFRSDDHRSRVDGWWDGRPQERVREEPEG